jgi:hypothetical protein
MSPMHVHTCPMFVGRSGFKRSKGNSNTLSWLYLYIYANKALRMHEPFVSSWHVELVPNKRKLNNGRQNFKL